MNAPSTPNDARPILNIEGLVAGYDGVPVLHGVDLAVSPGEVLALLGANGAGKTTLLNAVSGLVPTTAGRIEVFGDSAHRRGRGRTAGVWRLARAGLAHVPEDRGLFFGLTTAENLRLGRPPNGRSRRRRGPTSGPDAALDRDQVLRWFPALEQVMDRKAGLLSGGEQQMVALARAVLGRPRLLLVDELSLGLAPIVVEGLLPILRSIADETGIAMVVVEQHVSLVLSIADRAILMQRGRVAAAGTAAEMAADAQRLEAGYLDPSV